MAEELKIFIGQLPRTFSETDVEELVQQVRGSITECRIIRDKISSAHRGCAFVHVASRQDGEYLVQALDQQHLIPTQTKPLACSWAQTKPKEAQPVATHQQIAEQPEQPLLSLPVDDSCKLFIGQIPKSYTPEDVTAMLTEVIPQKDIHNVRILTDKRTNESSGACFVRVADREAADYLITKLHNRTQLAQANRPLQIKYAAGEESKIACKLFVGLIGHATESEVRELFQQTGDVQNIDMISKGGQPAGCAFVTYSTRRAAEAAITMFDGKRKLAGNRPVTVKWADTEKDKELKKKYAEERRVEEQLAHQAAQLLQVYDKRVIQYAAQQLGLFPQQAVDIHAWSQLQQGNNWNSTYNNHSHNTTTTSQHVHNSQNYANKEQAIFPQGPASPLAPSVTYPSMGGADYSQKAVGEEGARGKKQGPPGSNLFVIHFPAEWKDNDLYSRFEPFGTLLSCMVYYDKVTGESKRFGFVSYSTPQAAQTAIQAMNGLQVSPGNQLKVSLKSTDKPNSYKPY